MLCKLTLPHKTYTNTAGRQWEGPKDTDGVPIWFGLNKDVLVTGSMTDLPIVPTTCQANGTCVAGDFSLASDWIKYFILRDADADLSSLTQEDFADLARMSSQQYDSIIGTSEPDLRAFRKRGGKLVTYHGTVSCFPYFASTKQSR